MIITELYQERSDGVRLFRTYSGADLMIRKDETDEIYSEAIDVEGSGYTYSETDDPVEKTETEPTLRDALEMLGELGVDVNAD